MLSRGTLAMAKKTRGKYPGTGQEDSAWAGEGKAGGLCVGVLV